MARFPTYEEMGKKVAEEVLDGYSYKGKTLREWIDILAQTRWIPISERVPEDEQDCLITYEGMGKFHIKIATYSTNLCKVDKYDFHTKKDISGFYGYDGECGYFEWSDVVAWIPLPEPYKEDNNAERDA